MHFFYISLCKVSRHTEYRRVLIPSREMITSRTKFQSTYEAPNWLPNSKGDRLDNRSGEEEEEEEEDGFISRRAFDEACQALARRSCSTSSDIILETRGQVRSLLSLGLLLRILDNQYSVEVCGGFFLLLTRI